MVSMREPPMAGESIASAPISLRRRGWAVGLTLLVSGILATAMAYHGWAGDLLMDVSIGQWIFAHHQIPLHNWFTVAQYGAAFRDSEWGFSVLVAGLQAVGGHAAVYWGLVCVIVGLAGWVAVFVTPTGRVSALLLATLAAAALSIAMDPRPQLWSYLGFAWTCWAVRRVRATGSFRTAWWVVAGTVLWANLHASWVLVPGLFFCEAILGPRESRWRWVWLTAAAGAAGGLRPIGWGGTGGFIATIFQPALTNSIQEWMSPNFHTELGWLWLPWIVLAWAVVLPQAWRRRDFAAALWMLVGPLMGLWAVRFIPYAVLGTLALLPEYWPESWRFRDLPGVARGALASMVLLFWGHLGQMAGTQRLFLPTIPTQAIHYLQKRNAKNVVSWYPWGDALQVAGVRPWTNGQAQLFASQPWWLAYVHAQFGQENIGTFANRWDPHAQWILWPINGFGVTHPPGVGWHLVQQSTMTGHRTVGVWQKTR